MPECPRLLKYAQYVEMLDSTRNTRMKFTFVIKTPIVESQRPVRRKFLANEALQIEQDSNFTLNFESETVFSKKIAILA